MKNFTKDWKTNLFALAAMVVLGLYINDVITTEQLVAIQSFIVAMGFAVSKDAGNENQ